MRARGRVVGRADPTASLVLGFSPHAFLWENGTMTDLGTLDGLFGVASGINARGQVVADSSEGHAFLWENGKMTNLGTLSGLPFSSATATGINARGQVVDSSSTTASYPHAFLSEN